MTEVAITVNSEDGAITVRESAMLRTFGDDEREIIANLLRTANEKIQRALNMPGGGAG